MYTLSLSTYQNVNNSVNDDRQSHQIGANEFVGWHSFLPRNVQIPIMHRLQYDRVPHKMQPCDFKIEHSVNSLTDLNFDQVSTCLLPNKSKYSIRV